MRYIQVTGNPYEHGKRIGTQFSNEIKQVMNAQQAAQLNWLEEHRLRIPSSEELLNLVKRGLPYAVDYAPDLIEELKGLADGAEIDFDEILIFNYFLDTDDLGYEELNSSLLANACTCFAVAPSVTVNEHTYIGQNYDWSPLRSGVLLMNIASDSAPTMLCFTVTGLLGCAGMNSAGIGIVINKLVPNDSRPGVPYTFVLRKALEQSSIAKAIDVILAAHRSSGINYLLADKYGEIFCLETTATDSEVIYALDDYIGHTNHYVHPRLTSYDSTIRGAREGNSYVRWNRINRLLRQSRKNIDLSHLIEFCRDHIGSPDSICNHHSTVASIVMDLNELAMWISVGNPCENPFENFSIG